jgi:hypothetical protein
VLPKYVRRCFKYLIAPDVHLFYIRVYCYRANHTMDVTLYSVRNYERVSKSFRTGRLELELQMVQFSATRSSCIAIL